MAAPSLNPPTTSLSFTSLNDDKPTTIILLHGGFTSRLEFALVIPHLSAFHLLLPDLPLHSASRHITPGTTDNSARHVVDLIQAHAHGGQAHVVGVSMGGYIGQCLALDRPDLVRSLFVTGAAPAVGKRLFMARWTTLTYYSMKLMLCWLPEWVYRWQTALMGLKQSDDLVAELRANITWPLVRDMFPWILGFTLEDVRRLRVRTLTVAGARGDDVPMLERTADALRRRRTDGGEAWPEDGSGGVVLREAEHAWDLQFPELFAQGVAAWVEGGELPKEFERV
ncbi:hypothetical protein CHGG_11049 [Chaetomium globosum CBS 148.51]|uniref:AB hydrolase-1 domain-containing protein n=1 Tax=Chaetomium globosum (strain ATCC 6205 / CBS 148.51 / DSM 1962 / NBRC 6347 / NRRL 1970) TaxID=306901 RepID=Q2GM07_CHAGB|nr:uncharacterized protein CHGG_11049 [Chaetomium globosum CBS 148.51]EAQ82873.1 hypothetical protein CHGG_11049 [Chaetomium globosum CBS 148.51]